MNILKTFANKCLNLSEVKKIDDIDTPSTTELHKRIIQQKQFLKMLYTDWYMEFKRLASNAYDGVMVELGSGGGFLKTIIPNVITSDILFVPGIDMNFSVFNIPFKNNTIGIFFMLDVFHHINNPFVFLKELNRCLRVGGRVIMIEPANTLWGRFIWSNFHHEVFEPQAGWSLQGDGPLSSSNSAIVWIVFFRDRARFKKDFPMLKINRIRLHTPLRYLISGGVSKKQLLPSFAYNIVRGIEYALSPFNKYIGMFLTIEIEKIS